MPKRKPEPQFLLFQDPSSPVVGETTEDLQSVVEILRDWHETPEAVDLRIQLECDRLFSIEVLPGRTAFYVPIKEPWRTPLMARVGQPDVKIRPTTQGVAQLRSRGSGQRPTQGGEEIPRISFNVRRVTRLQRVASHLRTHKTKYIRAATVGASAAAGYGIYYLIGG